MTLLSPLLSATIILTPVILLLLILTPLLDKKFAAIGRYWLWALIMLGLCAPFVSSIPRPVQINVPMPAVVSSQNAPGPAEALDTRAGQSSAPVQAANTAAQGDEAAAATAPAAKAPAAPSLSDIILYLWLTGVAGSLGYQLITYRAFSRHVRRWGEPVTESDLTELFLWESARIGARGKIRLLRCKGLKSPMIMGFVKPRLLLPALDYDRDDLPLILRHELTHYRRGDLWYKLALVLMRCVYWFNPAVHLMAAQANKDIETICDTRAVSGLDITLRKRYSEIILSMAVGPRVCRSPLTTRFTGGKHMLKQRFSNILGAAKKRGVAVFAALGAAVLVTGALVGCDFGQAQSPRISGAAVNYPAGVWWYTSNRLYQSGVGINNGVIPDDRQNLFAIDTDGAVLVTYDGGMTCMKTPVTTETIDENIQTYALIDGNVTLMNDTSGDAAGLAAYVSRDKTAICYGSASSEITMAISSDAGQTWSTAAIPAPAPAEEGYVPSGSAYPFVVRFVDSQHGWLTLCAPVAMNHQEPFIYTTSDGGATWTESPADGAWYGLGTPTGVGFSTKDNGFICFSASMDSGPVVFATYDGGNSWNRLTFSLPEGYSGDSKYADSPAFDGADGVMLVHASDPSGNYAGVIYVVTHDYGVTWFASRVDLASASDLASPASTPSPTPAPNPVSVAYATDALLGQYAAYDSFDETEYINSPGFARVVFTTDTAVRDFKYITLNADTSGENIVYSENAVLYSADTLTPDKPVVIGTVFGGDLVWYRGISFVDADGATRYFCLAQSGLDGSPLLIEFP